MSKSKKVLLGVDNNMCLDTVLNSADRFGIGTFEVNAVKAFGPCYEPLLDVITRKYKPPKSKDDDGHPHWH